MVVKTIEWKNDRVLLIDQRRLPNAEVYYECRSHRDVAQAIRNMVVRGAPAIGVAAAMGVALGSLELKRRESMDGEMKRVFETLASTRPTAVNLRWALERMARVYEANRAAGLEQLRMRLKKEARRIYDEDIAVNRSLGMFGARLLKKGASLLTHCNAGALATAGYGTALGVIRALNESGKTPRQVFVNETRPFLQGARLTAWELKKENIPATLITDSMAGYVMKSGRVDAVVVGCDRVAANGDVANKIGTYTVAVLARRHGLPFYVACPTSTIDLECASGDSIPIEQRNGREITHVLGRRIAPDGMETLNPAFDVTDHALVSAIITEKGVLEPPYRRSLRDVCRS